jgi:KUP system potassium uptake protein
MTNANRVDEIEEKVMYSILQKKTKRADIYWFVHVNILSEPYKTEYKVTEIIKDDLYRVDFNLGFREPNKINLMFEGSKTWCKKERWILPVDMNR